MMKIFHISDLHYNPLDDRGCKNIDNIFQSIGQYKTDEDLLVITGDIINKDFHDYAPVFNKLQNLGLPFLCITGNHDSSQALMAALKQYCPKHPHAFYNDKADYVCNDFPFKIIALDSYLENTPGGHISAEQLAWAENEIIGADKPVVILVHQFPLDAGLAFFDVDTPRPWRHEFNKMMMRHRNKIKLVLCGHVHNALCGNIGGVSVISSFSANWQANLDFSPLKDLKNPTRPVGYFIHNYNHENFISYAVAL